MEASVYDSFDVTGRASVEYGAGGVVAVVSANSSSEAPEIGKRVLIVRPDGWMVRAKMGEVRKLHENKYGIFIRDLTTLDVPVGTHLRWDSDFWPTLNEDERPPVSLARLSAS